MLKQLFHLTLLSVLPVFFMAACDHYPQDTYQEYYVVESYLVANRALPRLRLTKTLPVDQKYTFEKAAVSDASVTIQLLDAQGNVSESYPYYLQSAGVYQSTRAKKVLPERRYKLLVTIPNTNSQITATTLVPGAFHTVGSVVDSIAYQDPKQINITTTRSSYPDRQSYFIFTVNAVTVDSTNLTPFYRDQLDNSDTDLSDFAINSSGIINEDNYTQNNDGTLTLRIPWLAVAFYGDNDITANAIDDNMYDFLRSQSVQGGGSTLPPGEIQNVIYHVEGGIGIFGSLASDTNRVYIKRTAPGN